MDRRPTTMSVVITKQGWSITYRTGAKDDHRTAAAQQAVAKSRVASGTVIEGAMAQLSEVADIIVQSVEETGDDAVIALQRDADGPSTVIRLSGPPAKRSAIVPGSTVKVMMASTGYFLTAAGKAIAFIPNESSRTLQRRSHID
jgi:hypothetical protein